MSDPFLCDKCGKQISDGHTVATVDKLYRHGGVLMDSSVETHHFCSGCYPSEPDTGLLATVKQVLGRE